MCRRLKNEKDEREKTKIGENEGKEGVGEWEDEEEG